MSYFDGMGDSLALLYRDKATIWGHAPQVINGATQTVPVLIVKDLPAKLSTSGAKVSAVGDYGTDEIDAILFIDHTVKVPAGAIIEVTVKSGEVLKFKRASRSYSEYESHQEIALVRDDKAVDVTAGLITPDEGKTAFERLMGG